jgi:hypothetical protein
MLTMNVDEAKKETMFFSHVIHNPQQRLLKCNKKSESYEGRHISYDGGPHFIFTSKKDFTLLKINKREMGEERRKKTRNDEPNIRSMEINKHIAIQPKAMK